MHRIIKGLVVFAVGGYMLAGCQKVGALPAAQSSATVAPTQTATVTQTPEPTSTPTPPPPPTLIAQEPPATRPALPCRDGLMVVMDLSYASEAGGALPVLPSTSRMEKGWRVRNSGTCTWDSSYILAQTEDAPNWAASSQANPLVGSVRPGAMYDFWVELTAPLTPGVYKANWELKNGRGTGFGDLLSLSFEVASLPTGTPPPDVSLVAEPLEVQVGEEARISWTTIKAKAAYFYYSGQAWREHPVEVNGSTIVRPERTTTYELRVVNGDDTVDYHRITIEVVPFDAPEIRVFRINPGNVIDLGQCVTIEWRVTGRVNTLTVLREGAVFWSSLDEEGDVTDCPVSRGVYRYSLQAIGPGGEAEAERQLDVR